MRERGARGAKKVYTYCAKGIYISGERYIRFNGKVYTFYHKLCEYYIKGTISSFRFTPSVLTYSNKRLAAITNIPPIKP